MEENTYTFWNERYSPMNRPLIFLHGSADSASIWRLQLEHFSQHGRNNVFAFDLPGHGQRPDIFSSDVTIQDYARAAREIIKHELRVEQPILAGHSLGGAIALTMALEYGEEMSGLILIGTGARLRVLPSILERARTTPQETRQQLVALATAPSRQANIVPTIISEQATPGLTILYRDLAACNSFDVMSRLQEVSSPTLIICGAEDHLTPVKYSEYLHQQLTTSTLCIIPDAGHYVMREQPEKVNQAIERWQEA
jgi:pimeloyl-ACP methyl ester carboxylesterase